MSALVACTALAVASMATAATAPTPTGFFSGNINSCSSGDKSVAAVLGVSGPWNGANSGSWPATQVSGDGLTVAISNVTTVGGQLVFDWSSNLPVDLAVVKQGPGGAYWLYNPAVTSGTLAAYKNGEPSGGVSHVLFCYHPASQGGDPKLLVSKTAETHVKKTYDWSIAKKERDGKTQLNGQVDGPAGTANYEIKVTKELVSTEYSVSGVITVKNDSATNLVAATVTDTLPGATDLVLALPCTGAFALAAGATIECAYTAKLPTAAARTNTALADSGSDAVADGSGTAAVSFDDETPATVVNDAIDVSDNFATPGSTSDDKHWTDIDETTTLSYAQAFTCGGTSGTAGFTNVASIDGSAKSSSWTVQVICAAKETETPPTTPPATTPPASTPPASTPPASTPTATTPPPTVVPPFTPPVAKPKPKPTPKPAKAPAVCTIVTVTQKAIPAGKKAKVTIRLTAAGKPVAGARVRLVGPGINRVVKTGKNGVASVSVNAKQAGIVTVTVVGKKSCSSTRLGVVGTFEPPVTG
jgi:hypothetical protein